MEEILNVNDYRKKYRYFGKKVKIIKWFKYWLLFFFFWEFSNRENKVWMLSRK